MHLSKRLTLTILAFGTALVLAACGGNPSSTLTKDDCAITTVGGTVQNGTISPALSGLASCTTDTEHVWIALTPQFDRTTQSSGRPVEAPPGLALIPSAKVVPDQSGSYSVTSMPVPARYGMAWTLFVVNQQLSDKLAKAAQGESVIIGDGDRATALVQTGGMR